jgi:hemerythrin-like domain-containing protein
MTLAEGSSTMNAIDLLTKDHREVQRLLERGDDTTERAVKTRPELLQRIADELRVHEAIEEEIFYPALEEHAKTKEIALEGYEEHHVVDGIVDELAQLAPDDETWGAKFTVMKENLEHHIEEEEGEMFPKARQVMDDDELEELGRLMEARREDLRA